MKHPIYKFLKENNLTQKSEVDFINEYSNPQKSAELYKFFAENNLTSKSEDDFYQEYFNEEKKKFFLDSSKESTEPQEQPTTPSAKPTPKAPLPSTPNELLYTGALKGFGGESKQGKKIQETANRVKEEQKKPEVSDVEEIDITEKSDAISAPKFADPVVTKQGADLSKTLFYERSKNTDVFKIPTPGESKEYAEKITENYLDYLSDFEPDKAENLRNAYNALITKPKNERTAQDERFLRDLQSDAIDMDVKSKDHRIDQIFNRIGELQKTAVNQDGIKELNDLYGEYYKTKNNVQGAIGAYNLNRRSYGLAEGDEFEEQRIKRERFERLEKGEGKASEFFRGIGGAILRGSVSIAQVPKVLGDLVGDTDYDWADELYNSIEGGKNTMERDFGAPLPEGKTWSDLPFMARAASVGGNALGSAGLYAAGGGLFGGASKLSQGVATFGTAFLTSESDYYQEAIDAGMDNQDAAFFGSWMAAQTAFLESLIPDVKYLSTDPFRKSVRNGFIDGIKSGATKAESIKLAFKNSIKALPESAFERIKTGTKETFVEEFPQQLAEDISKTAVNSMGQKEYFNDTFNPDAYVDAIIGSYVATTGLSIFSRPQSKSPVQEELIREIAERKDDLFEKGTATDKKTQPEYKKEVEKAAELLSAMKSHSSWNNLSREEQNHALAIAQQAEIIKEEQEQMKKIGVEDESKNLELQKIDKELKDIFSIQRGREIEAEKEQKRKELEDEFNQSLSQEYDKKDQTGLPSQVGEGQKPIETQPIQGAGAETTETSGVLQAPEEVTEPLKDVESTAKALEGVDINRILNLEKNEYGHYSTKINNPKNIQFISDRMRLDYLLNPSEKINVEDFTKAKRNKLNQDNDFVYVKETPTHLVMTEEWTEGSKRGLRDKYGDDSFEIIESKIIPRIKDFASKVGLKFVSHELKGKDSVFIFEKQTPQSISEAYHRAKKDDSNPELVQAVEQLLGKPKEATPTTEAAPEEVTPQATTVSEVVEEKPTSETEGETTVTVGGTAAERMRQRRGKRKGTPVAETQEKPKEEKPKEEKPATGETKVSEVAPAVRPARAVEASEGSNPEAGEDSAFEAAGMTREERDEWKKNNKGQGRKPKIEQLTQAVKDLVSGKKSFKDYYRMAKELMPSKLMDKVPIPATFKEIIGAVDRGQLKIGIVGLNKFVKKGMRVGLRIDIPSFNNHGKNVVTVHDRSKSGQEVIGYGSTGSIKNVNFRTSVPTAAKIGTGEKDKSPFAMAEGEWMDESPESIQKRAEEAMNSPEWVQVSMNPARNSFFFDKADGNPVVSADEVLQVGNLVLAKNPKKIDLNTAEGMAEFERMFSTTDKKTGVTYQYRTAEKTIPGEVKTGRKFTGRAAVNRVVDFLKKANIDVELVSDDRFKEVQKGTALTGSLDGLFFTDEKSGKIYLRESKVDTHFGDILAFHEGIHPVMNIVAKTNPKLYDAIHDGLQNLAKENSETGREIRRVIETQKRFAEENGWDPSTLKDEIIVEALAIIAAKGLSIPQSQRGLRNAIIDFLNKIAKILNIPTKSRNVTDADFRAFVKKLSNAIREGGDIADVINKRDIVAEAFSNTVTQDISAKGSIREFGKTKITKSPILDDDDFINGVNTGVIKVLTPQQALSDNFFMMTFPDDLFVGKIIIDGKEVAAFGGGVIYAAVEGATGRVWASVDESTAKSFANNINKALRDSKNGEAIVVLVKGDDIKHQSSLQGKVGFMKTLMNFAKENKEYESQIINAIKGAYDLEKTKFDDVLKELGDYLSAGRAKSQETMQAAAVSYAAFRSSLIKEASPMLKDMHEKMGYGDEFFNQTGLKKSPPIYRVTNEFVDRIYADMLQEDFLNNLKPGSAYAAIKVRSEVTYVNDESHPSYPWVIKTVDGSGVELNIFSHTFMTYGPNEAVTGRGVEKGTSGAFGRASYTTPTYKLDDGTNAETPGAQDLQGKLSDYKKFKNKKSAKPSVSQERDMEPSLVDEAGLTKNMTEDGNGNYVFYHKTNKPLKTIDPKFFGRTLATSRDERPGVDISMYYTRPDAGESMVGSGYSYIVRVPKDKVYPINEDPLNLYDEAKRMFEKDYPGQVFDANKQVGYITKLAGQKGFPMTVTKWQKGTLALRAQTTTAMKPEVHYTRVPGSTNAIEINEEVDAIEPNEVKMRREKRRAKGSASYEREMEPSLVDETKFSDNSIETIDRVKSATGEDGATINLDGTDYSGGGLVVPAGSKNVRQSSVSASGLYKFLQDNLNKISSDIFKIGLYRFPDRPEVSYDLNIVIPSKYREIGIEFGRLAGQESLFDLDTYENVKTGATGENPIEFTAEELAEVAIALSQGKMPNIPQKGITGTAKASTAQDRGMDPELAYNEVDRMIEDGENSGMNGQQMYDSISKTEAYASLSPEDRSLVNDTLRSMGAVTSDPAASSIMSYDAGEKAAVLDALRDNKDLAYIYRNFREILTDLKEKGIIETDCI